MKLVHERVGKLHYLSFAEFLGDFAKIFRNTKLYNPADDDANLPEKVKSEKRLGFVFYWLQARDMWEKVERLVFEVRRKRETEQLEKVGIVLLLLFVCLLVCDVF